MHLLKIALLPVMFYTEDSSTSTNCVIYWRYNFEQLCHLLKIALSSVLHLDCTKRYYQLCCLLNIALLQVMLSTEDSIITVMHLYPTKGYHYQLCCLLNIQLYKVTICHIPCLLKIILIPIISFTKNQLYSKIGFSRKCF